MSHFATCSSLTPKSASNFPNLIITQTTWYGIRPKSIRVLSSRIELHHTLVKIVQKDYDRLLSMFWNFSPILTTGMRRTESFTLNTKPSWGPLSPSHQRSCRLDGRIETLFIWYRESRVTGSEFGPKIAIVCKSLWKTSWRKIVSLAPNGTWLVTKAPTQDQSV